MGQSINVAHTHVDDVVMFATDRSITGQDGMAFASVDEAREVDVFPGALAERLFEADEAINHIFSASNQVVVRRTGGWSPAQIASARIVIEDLFRFYVS